MLRLNFSNDKNVVFDTLDASNMIWHDTVVERQSRDPSFSIEGKRVVAVFRRLPDWILSRIHFEAARPPHHVATREMIVAGEFYANDGAIGSCDATLRRFKTPRVDFWVRIEKMHQDFETFFGRALRPLDERLNETTIPSVKDTRFWFTRTELEHLYRMNPEWAELEI
jgi:hypothetical protein